MMSKIKELAGKIEKNISSVVSFLVVLLLIIVLVNSYFIFSSNSTIKGKVDEIKEFNRPAEIELSIINCENCFDVSGIVDGIKAKNVKVNEESVYKAGSGNANSLIGRYGIKKLPSVLIFGEVNKLELDNFKLNNDALVLSNVNAPYLDLSDNKNKGEVNLISIKDSSCKQCSDLNSLGFGFMQAGVSIKDWKTFEYDSAEAKEIIAEFKIDKVPSFLVSEDIDHYENVKEGLLQMGVVNKKGYYVLHSLVPPYRELSKNEIVGLVDLVMLVDNSCSECYDVEINKQILERLGVAVNSESKYNAGSEEGKALIKKYDIKKVPMILLSPEVAEYDSFVNAWNAVGSVESDGWFVMRNPENLGNVKNFETGSIISAGG